MEAGGEGLWRYLGFGRSPGERVFARRPAWVRRHYRDQARAAIEAALPYLRGQAMTPIGGTGLTEAERAALIEKGARAIADADRLIEVYDYDRKLAEAVLVAVGLLEEENDG